MIFAPQVLTPFLLASRQEKNVLSIFMSVFQSNEVGG
jgi:hypothetical protein